MAHARRAGRLTADEVDALLAAPTFDAARFADFVERARAEELEIDGVDALPVGDDPSPVLALAPRAEVPGISDDPENQILNRYLEDISRFALLTRDEEVLLARTRRDAG